MLLWYSERWKVEDLDVQLRICTNKISLKNQRNVMKGIRINELKYFLYYISIPALLCSHYNLWP